MSLSVAGLTPCFSFRLRSHLTKGSQPPRIPIGRPCWGPLWPIARTISSCSYTINTVEALITRYGRNRYFLIIGADSLLDLPHWHRAAELLALVSLIVVKRDTIGMPAIQQTLKSLDPSFVFDQQQEKWLGKNGSTVEYLADVQLPVSSSTIRAELSHGRIPAMLPPAVFAYIEQHNLYGWRSSP
jgi:nicotinate-nucleotide adenylyltransferase